MTGALLIAASAASNIRDIRDIRGPIHIAPGTPWLWWLTSALAIALVALACGWLVRRRRRRALGAYAVAKARLSEALQVARTGRADLLAERVSSAVREYVEGRFEVRAAHRTTEDLSSELLLRSDLRLVAYRPELERLLTACDLAKFAGRGLGEASRTELCADAQRFVEAAESSLKGVKT